MVVAVIGLSLNEAAYAAEVVRGGILSVDQGQHEAAAALGLPKALPVPHGSSSRRRCASIIPNYVNQLIGLIKGTSLVFYVSLLDLFGTVQSMGSTYPGDIVPLLLVATVWYLILTSVVSVVQFYVERYYARGAARALPPTPLQQLRGRSRRPAGPVRREAARMTRRRDAAGRRPRRRRCRGARRAQVVRRPPRARRRRPDRPRPARSPSILGPSGSGKSTLLRTINHLEKPDGGHVSVDGELDRRTAAGRPAARSCSERDILAQRSRIGFVFQNFNLFPHLTVLDNVAEAPVATGRLTKRRGAGSWPRAAGPGRASATRPAPTRASCPAASSSASPSPARSRCAPA